MSPVEKVSAWFDGDSIYLRVKDMYFVLTITEAQDLSDELTNAAIDAEEYEDA